MSQTLTWKPAAEPPDADMTVLLWIKYVDSTADWAAGWWDGEQWRDAATGGAIGSLGSGEVTHWAEPEGPQ